MRRSKAFTLVELLAVIAIISILAAIIFPVWARARDGANRSGDLNAMNEIRSAILLYKVDNGGFPPALLGYVGRYSSGPQTGQVIPADAVNGFLFPKRVRSFLTFKPSVLRVDKFLTTTAVWPNIDPRAIGQAAQVDTNGDGSVTAADDTIGARQAYGPTVAVRRAPGLPAGPGNQPLEFYQTSGYDVAQLPSASGSNRWEIRYALFWSNYAIGTGAGFGAGSNLDDPRQLGYSDPPDETVITWNSFYRDWNRTTGLPDQNKRDLVLFLGGNARYYDSRNVHERSWRVTP